MKKLLILSLILFSSVAWGQVVTGRIVDSKSKETIPGANITLPSVKGAGVSSDFDGNFSIDLQGTNQIEISFVGYKSKKIAVSPGAVVQVELDEDAAMLSEVVVVGYGVQKKENLTGSVSSVNVEKTLEGRSIPDVGRGLQGSTPGLTVTIANGELGADPTMKIRGSSTSFKGNSNPLILVDNVEIPSISFVNPDDIETMSILKDASSASIYGAKGANGVILITTKKGKGKDKVNINYSNNFSWATPTKNIELAGIEGIEVSLQALERTGGSGDLGVFWKINRTNLEIIKQREEEYKGIDRGLENVYGRDWYANGATKYSTRLWDPYDVMLKDWRPEMTHNLSISGTSGKTSYNFSLGYFNQQGVLKTAKKGADQYSRYNASLNINSEVNKIFTLKSNLMVTRTDKRYPYVATGNDPYLYAARWGAWTPQGTQDGTWLRGPAGEIANASTSSIIQNYNRVMLGGILNLMEGWTLDFDYTYSLRDKVEERKGTRFTMAESWSATPLNSLDEDGNKIYVNDRGDVVPAGTPNAFEKKEIPIMDYTGLSRGIDNIYLSTIKEEKHVGNAFTTFDKQFGNHGLKVMLGLNVEYNYSMGHTSQRSGIYNLDKPELPLTQGTERATGSKSSDAAFGTFARINYDFAGKYLIELNGRYEGTSIFPTHLRWKFFPSGSLGYRISEEKFWKPIKSVVSDLKLRASYGALGNRTLPSNLYIQTYGFMDSPWTVNGIKIGTTGTPEYIYPDITWETISTLDIGIDARFLKDKLGISADYYEKTTTDLVVPSQQLPSSFGQNAPQMNYGTLKTTGYEIQLDFNHRFENGFNISFVGTFSDNLTKLTKYNDGGVKSIDGYYQGKVLGEIWGYVTDRLYQIDDFTILEGGAVGSNPTMIKDGQRVALQLKSDFPDQDGLRASDKGIKSNIKNSTTFFYGPGDVKYKDLNGDGAITSGAGTVEDAGDRKIIGNSTPRYEYSFKITADWKGIDASIYFQGVGKRDLWGSGPLNTMGYAASDGGMSKHIALDYWTPETPDAFYPRPWNYSSSAASFNNLPQTRYMLNLAYLRLKNLQIGYSLPKNIIEKAYFNKIRVFFSAENLLTFDKMGDIPIDPEMQTGSMLTTGVYNLDRIGVSTPNYRSLSFGIQLGL